VEKLTNSQAIVGIPKNRLMANGKAIKTITKKGQLVQITGFKKMINAALLTLQQLLPAIAISLLLIEIESKRELLASQGMALELVPISI
jgi:hypothetical protein